MTVATQVTNVTQLYPAPLRVTTLFNPTLTPVSVAANTTAEQTFTVLGLTLGTAVYVVKPSFQAGLGVVNARVSAANTLAITFSNNTSAAIVPASEAYIVADDQSPVPSLGN